LLQFRLGHEEAAVQHLKHCAATGNPNWQDPVDLALALFAISRYRNMRAVHIATGVLARSPGSGIAQLVKAMAMKFHECRSIQLQAEPCFEAAREADPSDLGSLVSELRTPGARLPDTARLEVIALRLLGPTRPDSHLGRPKAPQLYATFGTDGGRCNLLGAGFVCFAAARFRILGSTRAERQAKRALETALSEKLLNAELETKRLNSSRGEVVAEHTFCAGASSWGLDKFQNQGGRRSGGLKLNEFIRNCPHFRDVHATASNVRS